MNEIRDQAEPIADEIIQKVGNYLRYKLEVWIREEDYLDIKRIVKSILVQRLSRRRDAQETI